MKSQRCYARRKWVALVVAGATVMLLCQCEDQGRDQTVTPTSEPTAATSQPHRLRRRARYRDPRSFVFRFEVWNPEKMSRVAAIMAEQKTISAMTWEDLQDQGLASKTALEFEFFYVTARERSAQALRRMLSETTDYELEVVQETSWLVRGLTQPIIMSADEFDFWLEKMISAGVEYNCEFDGWSGKMPRQ